ncbi:TonB-dependent receptor plug domain-containing protein [Pseudoalteromonas denitrificans]|uniref:Outer membrane receptor proteins, mostly Fe transport n=1 Tax=Pseudoalteromonas denitrificans DSM 6059 TaxID=1123010 RepID=A0A1I1KJ19_9GAMM|nr:TonB-dependent receptor [Pseudoalteromonas denitrificans]SFC60769.1 Outer membrane receptor proteins, mostly Fe transport [Pseudoalteromonas denitrificans DSM 6059]
MKIQFKLTPIALCVIGSLQYASAVEIEQSKKIERIEVQTKRSSVLTHITENAEKLISMPGAMGDPLQAVFALPGVVAAGGAMSEPAVRGSSPSDNLFEVDFMPAGYIFHDFGSSIFNKYVIQDFQLFSAGYGTSYSNATGAVFDVSLRNPKYQKLKTTLDFTMFNAGIFTEGQLTENTAFYFSARKSTLPLFFDEGEEIEDDDGELTGVTINKAPDDHDYQGKLIWDINHNNMFTFSFTGAQDSAKANFNQRSELALKNPEYQGDATFKRGFNSQSILWDHYGDGVHVKLGVGALSHTELFEYGRIATGGDGFFEDETQKQITYKARVNYQVNSDHNILFDAAYHDKKLEYSYDMFQYTCTDIDPDCTLNKGGRITDKRTQDVDDQFVGLAHIWQITDKIQSDLGVQWQHNNYSKETFIQPRVALNYFITDQSTVSLKYGEYNRLQDIDTILPVLGNPNLKSQTSQHSTLGFQQELEDEWSWSIEGYYKTMSDLPLALTDNYADSDKLYSNDVEGRAYGFDLLVNKNKTDKWYGWVSLSYAKSERTDLRRNITRDYYTDTPLVMNVVFNYQINERWNGGFNFTARSGQAYTPITGVVENPDHDGKFLPQYGEPFSERFDVAHRLDIRFERKTDFFDLDAMLIFEVMNVYGQDNVSYIDLDYQKVKSTNDLILEEETDDFEMRPSIGFSVNF